MNVICPNCGNPTQAGSEFCQVCGSYLAWDSTKTIPTVASVPQGGSATAGHSSTGAGASTGPAQPASGAGPSMPPQGASNQPGPHVESAVITLHAEDTELFVEAGDTVELVVRVRNDGTLVERVRISVGGTATGFAVPPAETIPIFPAAEESAVVRFSPPRDSSLPAGRYNFTVRAASTVHQGVNRVVNGEVTVGGFLVTSASLSPESTRGRRRKFTHVLSLDNQGDMPWHVNVTAVDTSGSLTFDGSPVTIEVPLGTSSIVKLNGRAPTRWIGGTEQLPFQVKTGPVSGTVDTGDHRVMPATRMQIAWIPRWLPPALVAVLALAIAVWAVFLRPQPVEVPTVAGQQVTAAEASLRDKGFEVVKQDESHPEIPTGSATRTDPAAGTPLDEGETVTMFVSTGPIEGQVQIPSVRGLSAAEAEATLESVGLKVRQVSEASDLATGQALGTDPETNEPVDPGSTVTLLVSSGTPSPTPSPTPTTGGSVTMLNLVGMEEAEALRALDELGLEPEITREPREELPGVVAETDPGPGETATVGDTVALVVSTGEPGNLIQLAQQSTWVDGLGEQVTVDDPPSPAGFVAFEENVVAEDGQRVDALVTRPAPNGRLVSTLELAEPLPSDGSLVGVVGFHLAAKGVTARFTLTAIFPDGSEQLIDSFVSDNNDSNPRDLNYELSGQQDARRIRLEVSELNVPTADPLWIELNLR